MNSAFWCGQPEDAQNRSRIFTGIQWVAWPSSLMSSIDAAALAPVHRRVWQNNRPRRPPPMTSSTGNRSDGHGLCHGLDSAPAPRMSAPTQSHAPTCARAARGRAGRAIFIIRTHGNSCCRVRVAHRGHKPSLFAAHERECRMLTALCPIDGARAPPLAPCSEGAARLPASVGSISSHRVFECEVQSDPYT